MQAPSETKRFGTSCAWLCALRTEVLGSRPMRAVPISCTLKPGGPSSSYVSTSRHPARDRKSTRLNSSHVSISYAVFCWKKKNRVQSRDDMQQHIANRRRLAAEQAFD